jgi:hypothetical protein
MPELGHRELPAFLRLARLLDSGLFTGEPSDGFRALVPQTEAVWENLFVSARNNRALAPLCYIFATRPAFGALAGEEELSAMQDWHAALAFRSAEIRKQIVELAGLFSQHNQRFMLLKGAARLFDDLYPDISCRYSVDIDPLIEDPSIFYDTFSLGYRAFDDEAFDMKSIRSGDISVATGPGFHHLPPLYRQGDQASVELHTMPFTRKYDNLAIPDLWSQARTVDGRTGILIPSLPHQIIINVIHTLLHGLAKEQFSLSVRDLFEGHLLYTEANERQRAQVIGHFAERGYSKDFDLWKSVCFRVFQNPVYQVPETSFHGRFFERLVKTQADPKAQFRYRFFSKLKELFFLEIWNWPRLQIRLRHLASAAFWRRLMAQLRHSRRGRK